MIGTLREIGAEYAQKQPHQIDYLLAGTPLLDRMPFVPSTHGLQHVFERISEIGEGTFVKVDQALPEADVTAELDRINLGVFGFRIEAGIDKVTLISGKDNFAGYLARKAPKIMTKSGMRFESDYAKLLKEYAIGNGNVINAGGTGSDCHTVFVVRFIEDEVCGLYDENGFGSGALFDTIPLSGGNPYTDKNGVTVYGADFKTYCGFMIENPHAVAIVTNITKDKPLTQAMLDEACLMADVDGLGTAYIVGSGRSNQFINALKDPHYTQGESYSTRIKDWNGTEIINDSNFPRGEAAVDIDTEKTMITVPEKPSLREDILDGVDLPKNTSTESEAFSFGKGGQNSSVVLYFKVDSDLTLTTDATIEILHASKKSGEYTTLTKMGIDKESKAGTSQDFVLPPSFKGWLKAKITTTDSSAAGTVSVWAEHVAR